MWEVAGVSLERDTRGWAAEKLGKRRIYKSETGKRLTESRILLTYTSRVNFSYPIEFCT